MPAEFDRSGRSAVSRRDFLRQTAVSAGAVSLAAGGIDQVFAQSSPPAPESPLVVQVRSDQIVTGRGIHEELLADLLEILLKNLTGRENPAEAWRSILKADDVVGLKFNRSGANGLATTDSMLRVLVKSLGQAGFDSSRIVAVEVSPAALEETATQAPVSTWSAKEYEFGSGKDRLAAWLDQVTAIINVPFLKTHNIAGMTCCLKNLSHALVKHPAQYHGNGCSPYIGDIVALPPIRRKLRLHLVNALRTVFDQGPEALEDFIWDAGILLGGFDPVAVDIIGLQLLDQTRMTLGLPPIARRNGALPYLEAAAQRGVGVSNAHEIKLTKIKL